MKILHLPTEVGGNAQGLCEAERALGLQAESLVAFSSWMDYPFDRVMFHGPSPTRAHYWLRRLRLCLELAKIRNKYSIFHFNFATTLLDPHALGMMRDLPFYGKNSRMVFTFQGCDARLKYPTMDRTEISGCHEPDCYNGMCNDGKRDALRKKRIEKTEKYADAIFALNPDLLYFLPKRAAFLPYTVAGPRAGLPPTRKSDNVFRILHSPTNAAVKGTRYILAAVEKLKKKYGSRVELIRLHKVSHDEVLRRCREADLLVDQLLCGWYGAVSVEAMLRGTPTVAYIREEDLHFVPPDMAKGCKDAFFHATPATIENVLEEAIENPALLRAKREAAMDYADTWHNPLSVAKITAETYKRILDEPARRFRCFNP